MKLADRFMQVLNNGKELDSNDKRAMDIFVDKFDIANPTHAEIIENLKKLLTWLLLNFTEYKAKDNNSSAYSRLIDTMIAFLSNINLEIASILLQHLMEMVQTINGTLQ
jgi:hypothetical protein